VSGVEHDTVTRLRNRIDGFPDRYVQHWAEWLASSPEDRPHLLGHILRCWQACRPNRMRRAAIDATHPGPFIEDLIQQSQTDLDQLDSFDIAGQNPLTPATCDALRNLWAIWRHLSYHGRVRHGQAGIVGISKAVMLLTDGSVGPAFDREVRRTVSIRRIGCAEEWLDALHFVNTDIRNFSRRQRTSFVTCAPDHYADLPAGRLYDMALGPRE
jgi:hypothetical protein